MLPFIIVAIILFRGKVGGNKNNFGIEMERVTGGEGAGKVLRRKEVCDFEILGGVRGLPIE